MTEELLENVFEEDEDETLELEEDATLELDEFDEEREERALDVATDELELFFCEEDDRKKILWSFACNEFSFSIRDEISESLFVMLPRLTACATGTAGIREESKMLRVIPAWTARKRVIEKWEKIDNEK